LRPHWVKRRKVVKTIIYLQKSKENLRGGLARATAGWFRRATPALSG
jgi:hypothetical protein